MADLPETLTITVTIPPSNISAGSTVEAISTIGMGVPGLTGPAPTITNGTIATGAPGSAAALTFTLTAPGTYRVDGSIPQGAPGPGTGDVVGPAGATGDHVALFNGTTGKLIKDGGALGSAAFASTGAFATAAQGAKADSAVQPAGLTKAAVGLGNVDNTSDLNKPVSTAQQAALDLKAPLASPAFSGTPTGITKAHVGLSNVDNTSDAGKPVSTAQAAAIGLKLDISNPTTTGKLTTAASASGGAGFRLPHGAPPTSPVDGDIWTTSAGGIYARINGVTVGPLSAGGSGMTFVSKATASASASIIMALSSTYDDFEFVLDHLRPTNDGDTLSVTFSVDGGSTYLSSGYIGAVSGATSITRSSGSSVLFNDSSGSLGINSATGVSGRFAIFDVNSAQEKFLVGDGGFRAGGGSNMQTGTINGGNSTASAITHVKFTYSTGTIAAGTVKLFGIQKS